VKRLGLVGILSVVAAMVTMLIGAPSASASYGRHAQYQIAFSQNCNNADFCIGGNQGLGGAWGWAVLNSDGTGDLQITFCGHASGQGGGAGHEDVDIDAWHVDTVNGVFFIDSASDPSFEGDTPIPSTPGHYNLHPAPGVAMEITVKKIPNR
jgi:hypothetical protein